MNKLVYIIFYKKIRYGENLKDLFMIFFSIMFSMTLYRLFSINEISSFLLLQRSLTGAYDGGNIHIAFISSLLCGLILLMSIFIALAFSSYLKNNYSLTVSNIILKDIMCLSIVSFLPYFAFWASTSIISIDAYYLNLINNYASASKYQNLNYVFGYLSFAIFYIYILKWKKANIFKYTIPAFILNMMIFYFSNKYIHSKNTYFYLLNLILLSFYILIIKYDIFSIKNIKNKVKS